jgi:hypothetical protein
VSSKTRAVINELHEKLEAVRAIERTEPAVLPFGFGNLRDKAHGSPPRLVWEHARGLALTSDKVPAILEEGEAPPAGYRAAVYTVRIWMPAGDEDRDEGLCEEVLDQLVTATRLLADPDRASLDGMPYTVPTQTDGSWTQKGQVIDATVTIRVPVPAEPVDPDAEVTITSTEIRTGIESPSGEAESATDYEVNEWVDPDQLSQFTP